MKEKYDDIGIDYNLTRKADKYILSRLLKHLQAEKNGKYLDIGCGTGNYTIPISKEGVDLIGVEPSDEMLNIAKSKVSNVQWLKGKAEEIPLDNESVATAMASLTIHHWNDLKLAFKELSRVLKPKGRIVIFTATPLQMKGYWLNHYFPKMMEDSIVQMPSFESVALNMQNTHFEIIKTEKYFIKEDLQDLFLYSGKHDPTLYLNPKVRHGISSFSSLANSCEIKQGLHELEVDIATGKINRVIDNYFNDIGDYMFIIGQKK